jgi:hypothetical protein
MELRSSFSLRERRGVCERPSKKELVGAARASYYDSLSIVEADNNNNHANGEFRMSIITQS